jgi:acetyl-CoA acetyltransferase
MRAGCPISVPGMTVNRFCSSGLQTIALAAQRIMAGEGDIFVAGGVESISLVQNEMNKHHFQDEWLHRHKPETYWPMLQTAEYVARRYEIPREQQDEFGVQSQQRAAKARAGGKFKDEIVPITTKMKVVDKNTGHDTVREVTAASTFTSSDTFSTARKTDVDLQAAHACAPWVVVWGDHDVVNNNAGQGDQGLALLIKEGRVKKMICSFPRTANSTVFPDLYRSGKTKLELVPQGLNRQVFDCAGLSVGAVVVERVEPPAGAIEHRSRTSAAIDSGSR